MKQIKMVVFDLDGTLVEYEGLSKYKSSWDGVAIAADLSKEFNSLRDKYLGKPEYYEQWVKEAVAFLKGKNFMDVLEKCLPIPYTEGVSDFLDWAYGKYFTGILSNGVGFIAKHIAKEKKMHFAVAQYFNTNEEMNFIGEFRDFKSFRFKSDYIERIAKNWRVSLEELCYIGDGHNDIEVFKKVGFPVAFCPKTEEIAKAALENNGQVIYDFYDFDYLIS